MKYKPTIILTNEDIEGLMNGTKRIQCGQWFICPGLSKPSRFVGISIGGTIWAVHPGKINMFSDNVKAFKERMQ